MLLTIDPVLLTLGPLAVRWFGLLALLGLLVALRGSLGDLRRQGLSVGRALDALAWALPSGIIVARVVDVLGWWDYYLTHAADLWQLNLDGLSLWGGLLGGTLVAAARLKWNTVRRRRIFDAVVPNLALGIAIGRLGEFLDGHGQGLASAVPWATRYSNALAASPDFGVTRHPAQLYDALVAVGLFVVLRAVPRSWPPGSRAALFLVLYGLARVALGAVRLDPNFLFGLQLEQLLALGAVAGGVMYGLRPVLAARGWRGAGSSRGDQQAARQPQGSAEGPLAA